MVINYSFNVSASMLFRKKKEALEDGNTASPVNSNIHEYKLTKSIKNLNVSHSLNSKSIYEYITFKWKNVRTHEVIEN